MTIVSHEPSSVGRRRFTAQLLVPELWGALAVAVIWLAVLFVGVFGPDIENASAGGDHSSVPAVIPVAICAVFATWIFARYAFARNRTHD